MEVVRLSFIMFIGGYRWSMMSVPVAKHSLKNSFMQTWQTFVAPVAGRVRAFLHTWIWDHHW